MNPNKSIRNLRTSTVYGLSSLTEFMPGGIESRALIQEERFSLTLFSFAPDEEVSAYSIPGESMITVLEGELLVRDFGEYNLVEGESLLIPSNTSYSYSALTKTKIMIHIIK